MEKATNYYQLYNIDEEIKKIEEYQNRISILIIKNRLKWMKGKAREIEEQGYYNGGLWWKDGIYLYKQYLKGENRIREYIGKDTEKIKKVMEEIERGKELENINNELNRMNEILTTARYYLDNYVRCIEMVVK